MTGGAAERGQSSQPPTEPASRTATRATAASDLPCPGRCGEAVRTVSSRPGLAGVMQRLPAWRDSGAQVDHLHPAVARLRRLSRRLDEQTILTHADRLKFA